MWGGEGMRAIRADVHYRFALNDVSGCGAFGFVGEHDYELVEEFEDSPDLDGSKVQRVFSSRNTGGEDESD